jgi:hypothetical protein
MQDRGAPRGFIRRCYNGSEVRLDHLTDGDSLLLGIAPGAGNHALLDTQRELGHAYVLYQGIDTYCAGSLGGTETSIPDRLSPARSGIEVSVPLFTISSGACVL